jgi:uncharacterized protein (TIGR01777 family)
MRVLIAGATGFIGRALVSRLRRDGHSIVAWARSETRALSLLGADTDVISTAAGQDPLTHALSQCDAVVNVAGEPILGKRWTAARREVLRESRVGVAAQLVSAIEAASPRPRVLVSGSAVGFYGNRASEVLDESSAPRDDFLSRLCVDWEAAAERATAFGVRVVTLRTGVVLGRAGGALTQMLPPFKAGIGGPIGSGTQYFPWIHQRDMAELIATAVRDDRYTGPINAVAPDLVTSKRFARALGHALRRPSVLPTPSPALRAIFGDAAIVLLASQRVEPAAARRNGFVWQFPSIDVALADVVRGDSVNIERVTTPPANAAGATYMLTASTQISAPADQVFAFFCRAGNLGLITPAPVQFRIVGHVPQLSDGATLEYQMRLGPIPVRGRIRITGWNPPRSYVDVQEAGPYRVWRHEHHFAANGQTTTIDDRLYYAPRLGGLSGVVNRWLIAPHLREFFRYRAEVLKLRFGSP